MNSSEKKVLQEVRKNSRTSLTNISKVTGIPITSVFKILRRLEKNVIDKHVTLLDYNHMGFGINVFLALKCKDRLKLKDFLKNHKNVNSLYRTSGDTDFLVDTVFADMKGLEDFYEELEDHEISNKTVFYVIEHLLREVHEL